jgi:lysophospholipase L1-like esterase
LFFAAFLALLGPVFDARSESLDLQDGDRVVFVGGTFIERMQQYGYLETLLTVAYPDKHITFRNLGWSGDTVWGESRALFGSQADGYARLIRDVKQAKPTVLVICYGANEAHAGEAGLPSFVEGLNRLLDDLSDMRARVILLSPYAYQAGPPGTPDPSEYNGKLKHYCRAIDRIAAKRNSQYVSQFDLLDALRKTTRDSSSGVVSENGLHLTEAGYRQAAFEIAKRLGANPPKIDFFAADERMNHLRAAIHLKNELYFHRYRPQNETYLFLFRKHEQGNNAVEIPQFDPLVEEQEKVIAKLRAFE